MSRCGNVIEMTEGEARVKLDRLLHKLKRVPTLPEFRASGAKGSSNRLLLLRREWAEDRGLGDQVLSNVGRSSRYAPEPVPAVEDVEKRKRTVRQMAKLPTPETERGDKGRPYHRPDDQMSLTEIAIKQYRQSWKRIGGSAS